jgi:hypothetical protein
VVNGQFRSRFVFTYSTVAAAELEALPQRFSCFLSHRLLVRFQASASAQDGRQFAVDRLSFGSDFSQEIAEPLHESLLAMGQGFQNPILCFECFPFLSDLIDSRRQIASFGSL